MRASLVIPTLAAVMGLAACGSGASHQTAYITTPFNSSISVYTVNNHTGAFSQVLGSPYTAGISPSSIVLDPSHKFAYVANAGENNISLFKIGTTGALTEVLPRAPSGQNPNSLAITPAGDFLFASNANSNTITGYSVSASTGALTPLGGTTLTGFTPVKLAIPPSGKFLYVANSNSSTVSGFAIDSSGNLTAVPNSPVPVGAGPNWIDIDPSSKFLYVASLNAGNFSGFTIDSGTGQLTAMPQSPYGVIVSTTVTPLSTLLVDPSGKYLYVANRASNNVYAFTIDSSTGVPKAITTTPAPPYAAGTAPSFMLNDASGKFIFVGNQGSNSISVFSVTASTGVLTAVSTSTVSSAPTSMSVIK
jgi:YVTN family beta-propeller protein